MKSVKLLVTAFLCSFLIPSAANAATVVTDSQVSEIATIAQDGGDVAQAARNMLAGVTADLIAQGLTGDELKTQISVAVQELGSGLDAGSPNFEAAITSVLQGAAAGAVEGVNRAVGADPNLDAGSLTASVTTGTANAAGIIGAANPGLNTGGLQAAVNQGAQSQGAPPAEPEAFEPAGPAAEPTSDTPPAAPTPAPPTPAPPTPAPPTPLDNGSSSGGGGSAGSPSGSPPVS